MILSGNKSIAKDYIEGLDMLTNMRICSNVPAQSIVQTALGGHQSVNDYLVPGGRIYEQREYIYNALNSIDGITAVKPKAAFYIFPKIDAKKFNIRKTSNSRSICCTTRNCSSCRAPVSIGRTRTISVWSTCRASRCSKAPSTK